MHPDLPIFALYIALQLLKKRFLLGECLNLYIALHAFIANANAPKFVNKDTPDGPDDQSHG